MTRERVRNICLRFPDATEQILWGHNLVFKVEGRKTGKMFAVMNLEDVGPESGTTVLAFKCSREDFALLIENEDVIPAPYLARASWVSLRNLEALGSVELTQRLKNSYELVVTGLPKSSKRKSSKSTTRKPRRT